MAEAGVALEGEAASSSAEVANSNMITILHRKMQSLQMDRIITATSRVSTNQQSCHNLTRFRQDPMSIQPSVTCTLSLKTLPNMHNPSFTIRDRTRIAMSSLQVPLILRRETETRHSVRAISIL